MHHTEDKRFICITLKSGKYDLVISMIRLHAHGPYCLFTIESKTPKIDNDHILLLKTHQKWYGEVI